MRYQGGKSRIAKDIAEFINNHPYENYYDPFVGGASVLEQITKQPTNPRKMVSSTK